jgi:hypothetical protein
VSSKTFKRVSQVINALAFLKGLLEKEVLSNMKSSEKYFRKPILTKIELQRRLIFFSTKLVLLSLLEGFRQHFLEYLRF